MFIFQRSIYLNSSLAPHAEKKQLKLKFPEMKGDTHLRNAVVAVLKKNSKSNLRKVKLMFTAC